MEVKIVKNILEANERIARENRKLFDEKGVFVVNLMGGPGSGKTSLLEKTIESFKGKIKIAVIEGDIQSSIDAERVSRHGVKAVQINTGGACHLDGNMIKEALPDIDLDATDLLIVENVGNLVCPAEFNIGEDMKIMVLSVAEGDDKPKKYPLMFHESKALIINKIDLLPYTDCNIEEMKKGALMANPSLKIFDVSCRKGKGLEEWASWLLKTMKRN